MHNSGAVSPVEPGARLLIIHADDLGMCHSTNEAIFAMLEEHAISSTSLMVPCPWFTESAEYLARHPEYDAGIHLTLTSEWQHYKWKPLQKSPAPGLTDSLGNFWPSKQNIKARRRTVKDEFVAQVSLAMQAGVRVSHVDSHMCTVLQSRDAFEAYVETARRFKLPFFVQETFPSRPIEKGLVRDNDVKVQGQFQAMPDVPADGWEDFYLGVLQQLKPGLNQLTVHPGFDTPELRMITAGQEPWGAAWRQRDFDVLMGPRFKAALNESDIRVVDWTAAGTFHA